MFDKIMQVLVLLLGSGGIVGMGLSHHWAKKDKAELKIENLEKAIAELSRTVEEGLQQRDAQGLERFTINSKQIVELQDSNKAQEITIDKLCNLNVAFVHDRLVFICRKYIRRGCITTDEKGIIDDIYKWYSSLGGNGSGHAAWEAIQQLPKVADDVSEYLDKNNMTYKEFKD